MRLALEYATFADFRIRDSITTNIKAIEADLDEVGFEPSENTKEAIEQLESTITDIETERAPRPAPFDLGEGDEEGVIEREPRIEEDDEEEEQPRRRIVNVDDELED